MYGGINRIASTIAMPPIGVYKETAYGRDKYMKPLHVRFLESGECQLINVNLGRQPK